MTNWDIQERPNRVPWPPLLLVAMICVGFVLRELVPFGVSRTPLSQFSGFVLIAGALALDGWASLTFSRAKTTILPHRGTRNLVTTGPFQFSRNPIYVGNLLILAGVGLLAGSPWHVVLVPALAATIWYFAIAREEAHLAANFPEEWPNYSARVRRWL
jgi:protein-S-isoprenylcysteine O-methyltransferase Ste14